MTATQHAGLTPERWARFSTDQRLLMIANEMHRAGKLFAPADRARLTDSYERVLRLTDLTVGLAGRPAFRRELLRWRDLAAELYAAADPSPADHRRALQVLLLFTAGASAQLTELGLA